MVPQPPSSISLLWRGILRGSQWMSAALWACKICTMGCRGSAAPAHGTPPPPSLSPVAAELFLTHILTALFPSCNLLLHSSFSALFFKTLRQRHNCCRQDWPRPAASPSWSWLLYWMGRSFWQGLNKTTPVVPSLLKLCHLKQIEERKHLNGLGITVIPNATNINWIHSTQRISSN